MSDSAHFTAFHTRLTGHAMLANKVFTAVRVDNGVAVRANYVIAYPATTSGLDDNRYTVEQSTDSDAEYEYDVRAVAVDATGLLQLVDAVKAQLIGHHLTVTGRTCSAIQLDTPGDRARFDNDANLHYLDMTFTFRSRRA